MLTNDGVVATPLKQIQDAAARALEELKSLDEFEVGLHQKSLSGNMQQAVVGIPGKSVDDWIFNQHYRIHCVDDDSYPTAIELAGHWVCFSFVSPYTSSYLDELKDFLARLVQVEAVADTHLAPLAAIDLADRDGWGDFRGALNDLAWQSSESLAFSFYGMPMTLTWVDWAGSSYTFLKVEADLGYGEVLVYEDAMEATDSSGLINEVRAAIKKAALYQAGLL